jgi:hypothetical protein
MKLLKKIVEIESAAKKNNSSEFREKLRSVKPYDLQYDISLIIERNRRARFGIVENEPLF